jgi:hypothetical protein
MRQEPFPLVAAAADLAALLEEPRAEATGHWLAALYARLRVASKGPATLVASERLEAAGWPLVADADAAARAREAFWARAGTEALEGTVGSPAPTLVLVGERAPKGQDPFHSRSGLWLWRALRLLGHDELACLATNAYAGARRSRAPALRALHDALAAREPTWVALGREAEAVLSGCGIVHVAAPHPQARARFAHAAGVEGYAAELRAAGVPSGAWAGKALPGVVAPPRPRDQGPALATALGLALSVAHVAAGKRPRKSAPVDEAVARARALYVTGQADTLKAAAAQAGAAKRTVDRRASADGWDAERRAQQDRVREAAKAKQVATEADKAAACRAAAWSGLALGLRSVGRRLQDGGDLADKIKPEQVEALGRLALALTGKTAAPEDPEAARLAALGPQDLLREYQHALSRIGGTDDPAARPREAKPDAGPAA